MSRKRRRNTERPGSCPTVSPPDHTQYLLIMGEKECDSEKSRGDMTSQNSCGLDLLEKPNRDFWDKGSKGGRQWAGFCQPRKREAEGGPYLTVGL